MSDAKKSSAAHSPHVLNLSDQFSSLEGEVTRKIEKVRDAVAPVLQTADVHLQPSQQLAEKRIAAAEKIPEAPAKPSFEAFDANYYGLARRVETPKQARRVRRRERANERRFRLDPTKLLLDYDGKPDPTLTTERYAEAIRPRT